MKTLEEPENSLCVLFSVTWFGNIKSELMRADEKEMCFWQYVVLRRTEFEKKKTWSRNCYHKANCSFSIMTRLLKNCFSHLCYSTWKKGSHHGPHGTFLWGHCFITCFCVWFGMSTLFSSRGLPMTLVEIMILEPQLVLPCPFM